jgi:hypothetical protein
MELTDEGFIAGGQNAIKRRYYWNSEKGFVYGDGTSVQNPPWVINNNKIRLNFEDDINCSKYNKHRQKATCRIHINPFEQKNINLSWVGMAEQNSSNNEYMELRLDGQKFASSGSVGTGKGCSPMIPVVSKDSEGNTISPSAVLTLAEGLSVIDILLDTKNEFFHTNSYYEFIIDPFTCMCDLEIDQVINTGETSTGGAENFIIEMINNKNCCSRVQYKLDCGDWVDYPICSVTETTTTTTIGPACPGNCDNNLILNGDFELDTPNMDLGTAQNWIVNNVDVTSVELSGPNKNVWIDLNACSPGSIEQSFSTIVGQQYTLYFNMAGNSACTPSNPCDERTDNINNVKTFKVSVAGMVQNYTFDTSGTPNLTPGKIADYSGMGWTSESLIFTAVDSTTTLRFESTCSSCGCFGAAIDCVEVCTIAATTTLAPCVNLITNGDFSSPSSLNGRCTNNIGVDNRQDLDGILQAAPPWYLWANGDVLSFYYCNNSLPNNRFVNLGLSVNRAYLAQTISTVIGATYTCSFDMGCSPGYNGLNLTSRSLDVVVSPGVDLKNTFNIDNVVTGNTYESLGWMRKSFQFTATSSLTMITFRTPNDSLGAIPNGNPGPECLSVIDNVEVCLETLPPDSCTSEDCGGFPCANPLTDKCCSDGAGNCNCCPEITWVCCPGLIYCAASLGDCPQF